MSTRACLVCLAIVALLGACAGSSSSSPDQTESSTETTFATTNPEATRATGTTLTTETTPSSVEPIDWNDCGGGLQCGEILVPVDHDQPGGQHLTMAMVRVQAKDEAQGTIFVNPGGPGGSGIDFVRTGFRFDDETMSNFHLVGFDPRGIGLSSPIDCAIDRSDGPLPDLDPDDDSESDQLNRWAEAEAERCQTSTGIQLAFQSTVDVALDLDLARQAVGDTALNFYGLSYGSYIALNYASLFPGSVGHIVIDGVVNPAAGLPDLLSAQAHGFGAAFDSLVEACATAEPLPYICPNDRLDVIYDRVLARLEEEPVGQVGPTELAFATLLSLYDERYHGGYVSALSSADDNNYSQLKSLSDALTTVVDTGAYLSVLCLDFPAPSDEAGWDQMAAQLDAIDQRFGAVLANEVRPCANWPDRPDPQDVPRVDVSSTEATILVIGATGDPATPLANAEAVDSLLQDGRLVIVEAQQHTSYQRSGCVAELVSSYFNNRSVPEDRTRCKTP